MEVKKTKRIIQTSFVHNGTVRWWSAPGAFLPASSHMKLISLRQAVSVFLEE